MTQGTNGTAELTTTVAIAGTVKTFDVDTETTGKATTAAQYLLSTIENDVNAWLREQHNQNRLDRMPVAQNRPARMAVARLRRLYRALPPQPVQPKQTRKVAVVTLTLTINGEVNEFRATTTSTGDIHRAAVQTVLALKANAWDWSYRLGNSPAYAS